MSDTVVDSSVVTKWVLPEADSPHAERLLTEVAGRGERLIVLDLAFVEVANAIWKRHYRGLTTLDQARAALDTLLQVPVSAEPAMRLLQSALEIAAKYRRAIYDALFVALARDAGLQGVTADVPLHTAVHVDYPEIILLKDWP
jgi:predicted nucleic acid-binding protein